MFVNCTSLFSYAIDGLSADKLRLLLHPVDEDEEEDKDEDEVAKDDSDGDDDAQDLFTALSNKAKAKEAEKDMMDFRQNKVLASLQDSTRGDWRTAQVMYSFPSKHKVA